MKVPASLRGQESTEDGQYRLQALLDRVHFHAEVLRGSRSVTAE